MQYLTQNGKMAKSGDSKYLLFNWGIPAYQSKDGTRTCPAAGQCAAGCYATQSSYTWPVVAAAYERRLELAKGPESEFLKVLQSELDRAKRKAAKERKQLAIRVHDSGDFFSLEYTRRWFASLPPGE